jgi:multisubunit Na+/H+ antiporter MnhC subunit
MMNAILSDKQALIIGFVLIGFAIIAFLLTYREVFKKERGEQ